MARLFTAVELSPAAHAAVVSRQREIATTVRGAGNRDFRVTSAEQLHLTIVFIGEVDEARVASVERALVQPIGIAPFTLELGGCGTFPSSGRPRVLWLGVSRGAQELGELHRVVSDRLETVEIPRERRPYHPHLTIGRWRDGAPQSIRQACPPDQWSVSARVDHLTLFRSRLSPHGAEHEAIGRTALQEALRG